MTILLAPDKFKGSLTAEEVCEVLRATIAGRRPDLRVVSVPLADGGEGTGSILTRMSGGRTVRARVSDPLGRPIGAAYGISGDGTSAFIEMAAASGLVLLSAPERNPAYTSTVGTGELIRHALDAGVKRVVLGIGGSSTHDGGTGMAFALGYRFTDSEGRQVVPAGARLGRIAGIDTTGADPRLAECSFIVLCDVDNPLTGPQGAAHIYAPQKGADGEMIPMLDAGLASLADVILRASGVDIRFPGAGAGGGICGGAAYFLKSRTLPGFDFLAEAVGLADQVRKADVVVTGEGKVDRQTLSGKVVGGVGALCRKFAKPMVIVAGQSDLTAGQLEGLGAAGILTLAGDVSEEAAAMRNARECLAARFAAYLQTPAGKTLFGDTL